MSGMRWAPFCESWWLPPVSRWHFLDPTNAWRFARSCSHLTRGTQRLRRSSEVPVRLSHLLYGRVETPTSCPLACGNHCFAKTRVKSGQPALSNTNREEIENLDYQEYCTILKPCFFYLQNSQFLMLIVCVPFSENTYTQDYKTIS